MSRNENKHISSFPAKYADGLPVLIHVYQDFINGIPANKSLRTDDDEPVNRKAQGIYEVVQGVALVPATSDDSNAE